MKRYGPIAEEVLLWLAVAAVLLIPDDLPPTPRAVALVLCGVLAIALVPGAVRSVHELLGEHRNRS